MTLPELIEYFRNDGTYQRFCETYRLDGDAETVEIYMQKPFGLNGKLEFFSVVETRSKNPHHYNGGEFYVLFDFNYFLSAVKKEGQDETKSDIDIALRLLDYAEREV